jgi:hypothetical protein
VPVDNKAAKFLKKRTLTNLYNERPTWLTNAHHELDAAVASAYGWPADISEDDALGRLLELNQTREPQSSPNRTRRPMPEQLRREPELPPMPIAGGKRAPVRQQRPLPLDEPLLSTPQPSRCRRRSRRVAS